jgi:hypothetical protein
MPLTFGLSLWVPGPRPMDLSVFYISCTVRGWAGASCGAGATSLGERATNHQLMDRTPTSALKRRHASRGGQQPTTVFVLLAYGFKERKNRPRISRVTVEVTTLSSAGSQMPVWYRASASSIAMRLYSRMRRASLWYDDLILDLVWCAAGICFALCIARGLNPAFNGVWRQYSRVRSALSPMCSGSIALTS